MPLAVHSQVKTLHVHPRVCLFKAGRTDITDYNRARVKTFHCAVPPIRYASPRTRDPDPQVAVRTSKTFSISTLPLPLARCLQGEKRASPWQ